MLWPDLLAERGGQNWDPDEGEQAKRQEIDGTAEHGNGFGDSTGLTPESWVSAIDEQMAQMSQLLEGG